ALYRNMHIGDRPLFLYNTFKSGIAALGSNYVGFGVNFFDADNDGWEDIVIANGHVLLHPVATTRRQHPVLLRNEGGRFKEISDRGGPVFEQQFLGRGVAVGDLDNDGWPDVVISRMNDPVILLRNVAKET